MASCNEMGIRGGVWPSALPHSRRLPAASGRTLARSPCWFSRQVVGVQRGVLLGGWGERTRSKLYSHCVSYLWFSRAFGT